MINVNVNQNSSVTYDSLSEEINSFNQTNSNTAVDAKVMTIQKEIAGASGLHFTQAQVDNLQNLVVKKFGEGAVSEKLSTMFKAKIGNGTSAPVTTAPKVTRALPLTPVQKIAQEVAQEKLLNEKLILVPATVKEIKEKNSGLFTNVKTIYDSRKKLVEELRKNNNVSVFINKKESDVLIEYLDAFIKEFEKVQPEINKFNDDIAKVTEEADAIEMKYNKLTEELKNNREIGDPEKLIKIEELKKQKNDELCNIALKEMVEISDLFSGEGFEKYESAYETLLPYTLLENKYEYDSIIKRCILELGIEKTNNNSTKTNIIFQYFPRFSMQLKGLNVEFLGKNSINDYPESARGPLGALSNAVARTSIAAVKADALKEELNLGLQIVGSKLSSWVNPKKYFEMTAQKTDQTKQFIKDKTEAYKKEIMQGDLKLLMDQPKKGDLSPTSKNNLLDSMDTLVFWRKKLPKSLGDLDTDKNYKELKSQFCKKNITDRVTNLSPFNVSENILVLLECKLTAQKYKFSDANSDIEAVFIKNCRKLESDLGLIEKNSPEKAILVGEIKSAIYALQSELFFNRSNKNNDSVFRDAYVVMKKYENINSSSRPLKSMVESTARYAVAKDLNEKSAFFTKIKQQVNEIEGRVSVLVENPSDPASAKELNEIYEMLMYIGKEKKSSKELASLFSTETVLGKQCTHIGNMITPSSYDEKNLLGPVYSMRDSLQMNSFEEVTVAQSNLDKHIGIIEDRMKALANTTKKSAEDTEELSRLKIIHRKITNLDSTIKKGLDSYNDSFNKYKESFGKYSDTAFKVSTAAAEPFRIEADGYMGKYKAAWDQLINEATPITEGLLQ